MSRNARYLSWIFLLASGLLPALAQPLLSSPATNAAARLVVVQGEDLLDAFLPNADRVEAAFNRGLLDYIHAPNVCLAWRSLVTTQDTVGIKVFSAPGPVAGTRPAVVRALVRGLLEAGIAPDHVILWDRRAEDLRRAGYFDLAQALGVRAAGAAEAGYDTNSFYLPDTPVVGQLVWGDVEFGLTNGNNGTLGKKSFVSKLVSREMTKIISVAPLMSEYSAGVCGHFFSLGLGSVDNTRRFEGNPDRLAVALPELNALPVLGDRVVLYVTDGLLLQYEGGPMGYLQFSAVRNELWFGHDPVAMDTLALKELMRQRRLQNSPRLPSNFAIYTNAVLLQLGIDDPARIQIEKVR